MASLANKVGSVTGGGTGIGRATALAMARAGAWLVIGNRGSKLGEEVVRAIAQAGGRAVFQVTDVTKPEDGQLRCDVGRFACARAQLKGKDSPTTIAFGGSWLPVRARRDHHRIIW